MLKASAIVSGVRITAAGIQFLFNVLLARTLGAEGVGAYYLFLALVMGLSVLSKFGSEHVALREIGILNNNKEWQAVRDRYFNYLLAIVVAALVVLLVNYLGVSGLTTINSEASAPGIVVTFSLLFYVFLVLNSTFLRGMKKPVLAAFFEEILFPVLNFFGLLLIFVTGNIKLEAIFLNYLIAAGISALASSVFLFNALPKAALSCPSLKSWLAVYRAGMPFLLIAVTTYVYNWAGTWVVGYYLGAAEVGVYNIAWRIIALSAFATMAVRNVGAPYFAQYHSSGSVELLEKTVQKSCRLFIAFSLPVLLVIFFFGKEIMMIFGSEFYTGGKVIQIMAAGQLVAVMCGPTGYLLMMCGGESVLNRITFFVAIITVILSVVLTHYFGVLGAAFAFATGVAMRSLLSWVAVLKLLKIRTLPV